MQFLPIVERELRVAARQARTGWRRVLTTSVALVVLAFGVLASGQPMGPGSVGREVFAVLSWVGMIYALLAGPLATADCLSRERREGTLGLLFLTDLHSYDVVLGKIAAASLRIVLDLMAILPVVAIPILMGGVSPAQSAYVALTLVNTVFLSLAIGTVASAMLRSDRSALGLTLGVLIFLSWGLPFLGEVVLGIHFGSPEGRWFYMLCPSCTMMASTQILFRVPRGDYWLSMGATHALGWVCLAVAVWHTARVWRDRPAWAWVLRWRARLERWRQGSQASRRRWRESMLNNNPVSWLEGRDRLQERLLWEIILVAALAGAVGHTLSPKTWPDQDWLTTGPMLAQIMLCVWIAIQAPRRLADDKESGALELLLCTPVKPADIVRGCMRILRRRFGRAFLMLLGLALALAMMFCLEPGGWERFYEGDLPELYVWGLVVFSLQAYSLSRIGVYQGLAGATSLRATFMLLFKAWLLPWVIWFPSILGLEALRRHFRPTWNMSDHVVLAMWGSSHLLVCALFLAHANWRLHRHFRALAARAVQPVWWKRWRCLRARETREIR